MSNEKLISIIVPVYNVEKYLRQCLDSLISQIYENTEIILVNDGSTDCSGTICEEYAQRDGRIIVVHQENQGLSGARNTGLRLSKGDYIAFVDSDDMVSQNYLSVLYGLLMRYDADIACCHYCSGKRQISFPKKETGVVEKVLLSEEMLQQWHGENQAVETVVWNKLYKKQVFIKEGEMLFFAVSRNHEDVLISHLLVENSSKVVWTDRKLYYYRKRRGSIVNGKITEKKITDLLSAHKERLDFFKPISQQAYERLLIGSTKFQILFFLKACTEKNLRREKEELKNIFCEEYKIAVNSSQCSRSDKFLLKSFRFILRVIGISGE